MSVLVQRLGRLRGASQVLLRLGCDNGNHPCGILGAVSKHRSRTWSAGWTNNLGRARGFAVSTAVVTANDKDDADYAPEPLPENTYAHNFFLSSIKYANIVMQPDTTYRDVANEEALEILEQDWSAMTSAEIVSAVKRLSYNIRHSNEKIEPAVYAKVFGVLNVQKLTNNDLTTTMRHLVPFRGHLNYCSVYNNLCLQIDRECIIRFLRLPTEKMLHLCDVIYQMTPRLPRQCHSQYIWHSIRYLGNRPQKLSPQHLVQILFFLNIYRKPPINMYEIEFHLERCADELSINELAVAALGFFKTSTKIRSKVFITRIIRRTIAEIDVVDTMSIGALVKLIRYSMQLSEIKPFRDLLNILPPYTPRYTLMSLAHIAQACGKVAVYDEKLMDVLIKRLSKEVQTARLKDLERFLFTFSIVNIDSNNSVYQNVIEELRTTWDTTRAAEITKFPYVAARILGYMTTQNMYPTDLIKFVMAPEFVTKTCFGNYHNLSREYCVLDYGLRIEVPEYDGPFLKPKARSFLEKKYYDLFLETGSGESTRANSLFSDVLATCQELFNSTSDISVTRALPHYTAQDIIFCLDERNQLVPSNEFLSQFQSSDIKRVNEENSNNVRWIALVMGHHGLLTRNNYAPTGPLVAKLRQLSIIGYTPIMISYFSWKAHESSQEKRDYLRKLVFRDNTSELSNIT